VVRGRRRPESPCMRIDDRAADRQTHAEPTRLRRVERQEQTGILVSAEAYAGILDGDDRPGAIVRARWPSFAMAASVSRTVSRGGWSASSQWRQALASATMAASGWLISCAMEAASSPSVVTRVMCASSALRLVQRFLGPLALFARAKCRHPVRQVLREMAAKRHHGMRHGRRQTGKMLDRVLIKGCVLSSRSSRRRLAGPHRLPRECRRWTATDLARSRLERAYRCTRRESAVSG
jgi:hypothetical protein